MHVLHYALHILEICCVPPMENFIYVYFTDPCTDMLFKVVHLLLYAYLSARAA